MATSRGGGVIDSVVKKDPVDFGLETLQANTYLMYDSGVRAKRQVAELVHRQKMAEKKQAQEKPATKNLKMLIRQHSHVQRSLIRCSI